VVQASDGAGFRQVGLNIVTPGDEAAVRHLDGDKPLQLHVAGDLPHEKWTPS
jgi:hypothetical protein